MRIFEARLPEAPITEEERRKVREKLHRILDDLRQGRIRADEAYYALMGLAHEHLVPLTPSDVGKLRQVLLGSKQL